MTRRSPTGIAAHANVTRKAAPGKKAAAPKSKAPVKNPAKAGHYGRNSAVPPTPLEIRNGDAPRRGFGKRKASGR